MKATGEGHKEQPWFLHLVDDHLSECHTVNPVAVADSLSAGISEQVALQNSVFVGCCISKCWQFGALFRMTSDLDNSEFMFKKLWCCLH